MGWAVEFSQGKITDQGKIMKFAKISCYMIFGSTVTAIYLHLLTVDNWCNATQWWILHKYKHCALHIAHELCVTNYTPSIRNAVHVIN